MVHVLRFGCFVLLLFKNVKGVPCYDNNSLVEASVGSIVGVKAKSAKYYMYLGIPYAKVKDNVFGPSIPYPFFDETYVATDDSAMCPQIIQSESIITGTLDCLRLNIYVPQSAYDSKSILAQLPVMIWFYGGNFEYGFAKRQEYGPKYLIQRDVILVTVNYRTGPYGFMCLDIPEVPGNQGLRDQYLAIKWVKNNIQAFGGNPNQITLFGQDAGGHSIDLHLMSRYEILFNKIILQSASALSPTVLSVPDKTAPMKLARYMGFNTNDTRDSLMFLAHADTTTVIRAAIRLKIRFRPCAEHYFESVDPFLSKPWVDKKIRNIKNMPVLIGFNERELAASVYNKYNSYFIDNVTLIHDHLSRVFAFHEEELNDLVEMITHFYFGDETSRDEMKTGVIDFESDFNYIHPVHRTLQKYFENGAGSIYFYMFSYVGGRNALITKIKNEENLYTSDWCCASLGDELGYLFANRRQRGLSDIDHIIMERMTTMWTNFAKYSDPTPEPTDLLPIKWQPITRYTLPCLKIDTQIQLLKRPLHKRMTFWDLFYRNNHNYIKNIQNDPQ